MEAGIARILDANRNRATEALRVLEDYCRFDLGDRDLSDRSKQARHELADAFGVDLSNLIVRSRDVDSDVGRQLDAPTEYTRSGAADVAGAAAKRAAQALRVVEEYVKTVDADRARRFERLRYAVYEIERAAVMCAQARDRLSRIRLYVIVTESVCSGPWLETAERAIEGGADAVQLREKSIRDRELLRRTKELARVCRDSDVLFVLNDRPDIARLARADGVHVGQDDVSVPEARRIVGPESLVGVSTHTLDQARTALQASPDYIAVGPMFPSGTKPQEDIAGPELVRAMRSETGLPIVAIGGIDAGNVARVIEAGANCACVCSAIISQSDVAGAATGLIRAIEQALGAGGRLGGRSDGA